MPFPNSVSRTLAGLVAAVAMLSTGPAASAAPPPTCLPYPSVTCQPPPKTILPYPLAQILNNSRFDDPGASPNWVIPTSLDANWTEPAWYVPGGGHCGSAVAMRSAWYVFLFQSNAWIVSGSVAQDVTIPANGSGAYLDFWAYLPPYTRAPYDSRLAVHVDGFAQVTDQNPSTYNVIAEYSNGYSGTDGTGGVQELYRGTPVSSLYTEYWNHIGPIDVSQFKGQKIRLGFEGNTIWLGMNTPDSGPILVSDVQLWTGSHQPSSTCDGLAAGSSNGAATTPPLQKPIIHRRYP